MEVAIYTSGSRRLAISKAEADGNAAPAVVVLGPAVPRDVVRGGNWPASLGSTARGGDGHGEPARWFPARSQLLVAASRC
jgi:hypothetical protein